MSHVSRIALLVAPVLVVGVGWVGLHGPSTATAAGVSGAGAAGSPSAGRAVYVAKGCGGCHALAAGATAPVVGPPLQASALETRARALGRPLGPFVAEGIVAPDADVVPGFTSRVMRPFTELTRAQLDDLVSFLIGRPYTSAVPALPRDPVAACAARRACTALVSRWVRAGRLPAAAVAGAKIVAVSGCLSCHAYAGSGSRRPGPDLTRQGLRGRTAAALLRRLRCPTCVRKGSTMPSYAVLGDTDLRRVVAFLSASRGGAS